VLLKCKCGSLLLLRGLLYSPTFNKNIISSPQFLQSKEYKITMSKNYVEIKYQGKVLNIMFKSIANLYVLEAERQGAYALENPYLHTSKTIVGLCIRIYIIHVFCQTTALLLVRPYM
jgi:hypothetical protein